MTVGKNPHRTEGKKGPDEDDRRWMRAQQTNPSYKELRDLDMRNKARTGEPAAFSAEEQVGGSRPRVESRVKDAIGRREEREAGEGGGG